MHATPGPRGVWPRGPGGSAQDINRTASQTGIADILMRTRSVVRGEPGIYFLYTTRFLSMASAPGPGLSRLRGRGHGTPAAFAQERRSGEARSPGPTGPSQEQASFSLAVPGSLGGSRAFFFWWKSRRLDDAVRPVRNSQGPGLAEGCRAGVETTAGNRRFGPSEVENFREIPVNTDKTAGSRCHTPDRMDGAACRRFRGTMVHRPGIPHEY